MSDQGGGLDAGWHPDPDGRHEFRYRDESGWTDQVSDGGVTGIDPIGPGAPPATAPYAPPEGSSKRKLPIGILALVGVGVAAVVVALVVLLGGGDDDGGDGGGGSSGTDDVAETISEDEPFVVREVEVDAGQPIRVLAEPSGDLDVAITLGVPLELATTELFGSFTFAGGAVEEDELLEAFGSSYDDLFSDSVDADLSGDLSSGLSDDFSDFQEQLEEEVPTLADAGVPFGTESFGSAGDPDGFFFVPPLGGTYSLIFSGLDSTGEFDATIETGEVADDFDAVDPDDTLEIGDFLESFGQQRDFLCDEEFWGGDPADVYDDAEDVCDEEAFEDLQSELEGESTADFSDDTSDFSDDSSDFSDDSSDFSDDFSDDTTPPTEGDPEDPTEAIDEYGTDATFDGLADSCFEGDLSACDELWRTTPVGSIGSYENYGGTCGGRVPDDLRGACETTLG